MAWRRWGVTVAVLLATVLACAVSFIIGAISGQVQLYRDRYAEERRYVEPILKGNPSFSGVEINQRSNGGVWLSGGVASVADKGRLRSELIRAVGEARADDAIRAVDVE
jgi:hypothetical protein